MWGKMPKVWAKESEQVIHISSYSRSQPSSFPIHFANEKQYLFYIRTLACDTTESWFFFYEAKVCFFSGSRFFFSLFLVSAVRHEEVIRIMIQTVYINIWIRINIKYHICLCAPLFYSLAASFFAFLLGRLDWIECDYHSLRFYSCAFLPRFINLSKEGHKVKKLRWEISFIF